MTEAEFKSRIGDVVAATHKEGPQPHIVAYALVNALIDFVFDQAGAYAPERVEELIEHMRSRVREGE